ncbi:hypothetical protein Tco_0698107 [Tanacetum coccineum]
MSWFSRCSWCGGPFNGGNCRHCTNVSFRDEPVCDYSYNQTPDISNLHSQPLTSSFNQFRCFHCKDPLGDGVRCQQCTCVRCGHYLGDGFCSFCNSEAGNSFINDSNPNSFNDPPNFSNYPPQPQFKTYSYELCGNDSHNGYDCPPCVEDFVPIPSESEDTSKSDSDCDLPLCDGFSPINIYEEKSMTFSNPLFDSNDNFTSSDDESLTDEDVPEDIVKIYSNPLFEFDDEYISSDVNPLFDEVLENIESKYSYVSDLDEPALLVTPLSDANEDECFDLGGDIDEIDVFLDIVDDYYDSEGDIIYLESLLIKDTTPNLPPEVFLDHDPRSLKDKLDKEDLKSMVKVFDLGIHKKFFSPTYVSLSFEDRHYLSFTYVI